MKLTVPAKVVDCCDLCRRHGSSIFLKKCLVCQRECCVACAGSVLSSVVGPDVCQACANLPYVEEICDRYAMRLLELLKQRDAEICERAGHDY